MIKYKEQLEENLLNDQTVPKWKESELACWETPLFSILPAFIFRFRTKTLNWLHRTVFRIFNIEFTIGGLLFMASLATIIAYTEYNYFQVKDRRYISGELSAYIATLIFSFSSKNSIWALLTGASWERTLIIHKSLFYLLAVAVGFHLVYNLKAIFITISGLYMVLTFSFIAISANYYMRRYSYWLFYICHILGILVLIYHAYRHDAYPLFYGIYMWLVDVLIRFITLLFNWGRLSTANITVQKHTVKITIKKRWFKHKPGQYVFLWIPAVSFWETHPFTISSSMDKDYITLHIKNNGRWTGKLHKLAESQVKILVGVQGAYGTTAIDIDNSNYKRFILIAGGIGATPMLSTANSLCDQYSRGRDIDKVDFLWSVKTLELVDELLDSDNDNMFILRNKTADVEKINCDDYLVDLNLYFTGEKQLNEKWPKNYESLANMKAFEGRFDLKQRFTDIKHECIEKEYKKIAVMVCGPESMVDSVSKLTRQMNDRDITFDFHCETFEL